ncbi:MAG: membrane protein insertase YidC [Sandaracinus sp.]|nr:membrane protein insertase YidC [Sandaracinus sp.]MCB9618871.1 membrane protein insertase YidC [Sandaracinus sp.]MCB9633827.1 membrane protein insertase YidC [Sandaracinus sp.]
MDDPKRQFLFVGVIGALALGLYFWQSATAPEAPPLEAATAEEAPAAGSEVADDEPPAASPVDAEARAAAEQRFSIETEHFVAELSSLSSGVVSYLPKDHRYEKNGEPMQLVTTQRDTFHPQRVELRGVTVPADAVWQGEQISPTEVVFRWQGDGFEVSRRVVAGSAPYQLWSTVEVRNTGRATRPVGIAFHTAHYVAKDAEESGFIGAPSTAMSFGVCRYGDGTVERERGDALAKEPMGFGPNVQWAGITDAYFSNVIAADEPAAARCVLRGSLRGGTVDDPHGTLFESELRFPRVELEPGATTSARAVGYIGPNDRTTLRAAGHELVEIIDLGWFSFIADGLTDLLGVIQGFVGNWGFAIILLTLLVKLVFFPLTMKSFRSMAGMRKIKPQIDELNAKYADDREKKAAAMMELYRKEKINPASGCLPSLLQMPVWFALYRSLSTNIELYHAPFALWWTDLSAPDPFFVLPGLVAVLMHLQQRFTPSTMDPAQAKMMMYFMPIMIGAFMLFLPAGLCLYMVTNSTLTMLQQRMIYAKLDREDAAKKDAPATSDDSDDADDDDDDSSEASGLEPATGTWGSSRTARRLERKTAKKRQRRG